MVLQVMKAVRKFRSEKSIDHKVPLVQWLGGDDSNKPFDHDGKRRARAAERWLQGAGTVSFPYPLPMQLQWLMHCLAPPSLGSRHACIAQAHIGVHAS